MSKAWKGGSTSDWRIKRAACLFANQIDNQGMCTLAIPGVCQGRATQVHHTYGREVTGDDPRYLQAVCQACNNRVGNPQQNSDPPSNPRNHWM